MGTTQPAPAPARAPLRGHMVPCVGHCAACRGGACAVLRQGLLRLFDGKADVVDLVLHYHGTRPGNAAGCAKCRVGDKQQVRRPPPHPVLLQ